MLKRVPSSIGFIDLHNHCNAACWFLVLVFQRVCEDENSRPGCLEKYVRAWMQKWIFQNIKRWLGVRKKPPEVCILDEDYYQENLNFRRNQWVEEHTKRCVDCFG